MASSESSSAGINDEQALEQLQQWAQENSRKQVVIITAGKGGAGKSTLLNNFLDLQGYEAFEAHMYPESTMKAIAHHDKVIHGVRVRVVDTPCLHAVYQTTGCTDKMLCDLSALAGEQGDVLFYCVNLTGKFDSVDFANIETLNRAFGWEIWKRAILVFTWADAVLENGYNLDELVSHYCEFMHQELARREVNVEVRPISSFASSEDRFKFDGVVGIPVSNKTGIPPFWKLNLLLQCVRHCHKGNIASLFKLKHSLIIPESLYSNIEITEAANVGKGAGAMLGGLFGAVHALCCGSAIVPGALQGGQYGSNVGHAMGPALTLLLQVVRARYEEEKDTLTLSN